MNGLQVQEVIDEMGHPSIPLSVITKVAEIELLDVVDKVLLGNKWLRKTLGIQPKFPYLVDSFEARFVLLPINSVLSYCIYARAKNISHYLNYYQRKKEIRSHHS